MPAMYHATGNRESSQAHGPDWSRMGPAVGIAGTPAPEQDGCFPAMDEFEASWSVRINYAGGEWPMRGPLAGPCSGWLT